MALGRVDVEVGLDGKGFHSGLSSMSGALEKFSSNVAGRLASMFGIGFFARQIRDVINWGSAMHDLAIQIGTSAENMQGFEFAALKTGLTLDEMATALGRLAKARNDFFREGDKGVKAIAFSNIFGSYEAARKTIEDTTDIADLLLLVADKFNKFDFGAAGPGILTEVLGNIGPRLLPAFQEGLPDLLNMAKEQGAIVANEIVDVLDRVKDGMELLKQQMREPLAQAIVWTIKLLNEVVSKVKEAAILIGVMSVKIEELVKKSMKTPQGMADLAVNYAAALTPSGLMLGGINAVARKVNQSLGGNNEKLEAEDPLKKIKKLINSVIEDTGNLMAEEMLAEMNKAEPKQAARKAIDVDFDRGGGRALTGDALAKIGGFVGASNRAITIEERQLEVQQAMLDLQKRGLIVRGGI